jgi:hypothetical protein
VCGIEELWSRTTKVIDPSSSVIAGSIVAGGVVFCVLIPVHILMGPLSHRRGKFSGCRSWRRPPDVESSSEYVE